MQEPRLFRFLKSANTIIFFGVGLLLISVLGYAAYQIYKDSFSDRTVSNVVNSSAQQKNVQTKMHLGSFSAIQGTPYYFAPISSQQTYRQDYYDKTADSVRNYLFLNPQDKSVVRLVPKNDWLFLNLEKLGQKDAGGAVVNAKGIMYQVVQTDTNGDQRLTELDKKTIALSEVSGKSYSDLIVGVDRVIGSLQTNPTTLLLIYTSEKKNLVAEINVETRQLVSTQELPAID